MSNTIKESILLYNSIAEKLLKKIGSATLEIKNESVEKIATLLANNHVGLFSDYRLDEVLNSIEHDFNPTIRNISSAKILHVVTVLHEVGGHSSVLKNWITLDTKHAHHILVTNQLDYVLPNWVNRHTEIMVTPKAGIAHKMEYVYKNLNETDYRLIVFHVSPYDTLPLLSFSKVSIPKVIFNQSDHSFWLGSSIMNCCLDFRKMSQALTEQYRNLTSYYLPLPLSSSDDNPSKIESRSRLGIPLDIVVILSVNRKEKIRPAGEQNFYRSVNNFLSQNPGIVWILIGPSEKDFSLNCNDAKSDRFRLLGEIIEIRDYYVAADIFAETFPLGAGLAILESMINKCVPVFNFQSNFLNSGYSLLKSTSVFQKPANETEYFKKIVELANNKRELEHFQIQARELINDVHIRSWSSTVYEIYDAAERSKKLPPKANLEFVEEQKASDLFNIYSLSIDNLILHFLKLRILPTGEEFKLVIRFLFLKIQNWNYRGFLLLVGEFADRFRAKQRSKIRA